MAATLVFSKTAQCEIWNRSHQNQQKKKSKRQLDTIQYKMRGQGVRKVFSTSVTAFKVIGEESRFREKNILTGPVGHYVGAILGKLYGLGQ